jgi:hypothetical protein
MKTPQEPILSIPHLPRTAFVSLRDYLMEMQKRIHPQRGLVAALGDDSLSFLLERTWSKADAIDFARGSGYAEAMSHVLSVSMQLLTAVVLEAADGPVQLEGLADLAGFLSSFETVQ